MSEVERLVRAVLKQGGKLQVVFGEGEPLWDLVGVEEGDPRIEFENAIVRLSMNATTLEGELHVRVTLLKRVGKVKERVGDFFAAKGLENGTAKG